MRPADDYYEPLRNSSGSFGSEPTEARQVFLGDQHRHSGGHSTTNRESQRESRRPHDRFITGPDDRRRSRSPRRSRRKRRSPSSSRSFSEDHSDDDRRRRHRNREQPVGARPHREKTSTSTFYILNVCNIPKNLSAVDLHEAFSQEASAGSVVTVDTFKESSQSVRAEVKVLTEADASMLYRRFHGGELNGREITVSMRAVR